MSDAKPSGLWELSDGRIIELITPTELSELQNGTEVVSISGETKVVGVDYIDDDTRFGFLAYGILRDDQGKEIA